MEKRMLTITIEPDWRGALRNAGRAAFGAKGYAGERLNFETPQAFFAHLTSRRWALLAELLGAGEVAVRELARRVGRDVKRVHEDAAALVDLGLVERAAGGALFCPYDDIHVDMHMHRVA